VIADDSHDAVIKEIRFLFSWKWDSEEFRMNEN